MTTTVDQKTTFQRIHLHDNDVLKTEAKKSVVPLTYRQHCQNNPLSHGSVKTT